MLRLVASLVLPALVGSGCSALVDTDLRPSRDELRVGFLYLGPTSDHGWSKAHEASRLALESELSDFESTPAVNVPPADAQEVIESMIAAGHNVIVTTSHSYAEPTLEAALNYPQVDFLNCASFRTGPNLGSYFGRMYQVMYLAGFLAGRVSQTGRVGVVGAVVIPETVRHLNAFALGARSANPSVEVVVEWVGRWFDPPVERRVTQDLVRAGVDVVIGFTDTVEPLKVATATEAPQGPVYAIGYHNPDSCAFDESPGKDRCLTSAYWNWAPILTTELEAIRSGRWDPEAGPIWSQMARNGTDSVVWLDALTDRDLSTVGFEIEAMIPMMTRDTDPARRFPFRTDAGPIKDTKGQVRLAQGERITDAALLRMCWLVEGIVGPDGAPAETPSTCEGDR